MRRAGVALQHFADLDAHQHLQLYSGHIERDGHLVLNLPQVSARATGA